ncbi:hypothetical protein KC901_00485 [Patescibacteria group bacterium]|nr:hypothetical protein [Patescibacteria group bacterium]
MNNNDYVDKFISNIESIKMTLDEKNEMRNNLVSFAMRYTPVQSPYIFLKRTFAIVFIAVLSIGSLSNVASGQALPGDTLYPVKIAHEEIKLATTFNSKKKISYEIRRTEKRIQEATELATHNDLDSDTQVEIAENIKKQTSKVKEHLEEVKVEDPEEALVLNAELKSTIQVNAEALKKVSTTVEKQNTEQVVSETLETNGDIDVITMELHDDTNSDTENNVEVSFAKSLLESIDEEVKDIQDFETRVSEELTKDESDHENIDDSSEHQDIVDENSNTEDKEDADIESIEKEIQSLEDILSLKKQIAERKAKLSLNEESTTNSEFNEQSTYKEVDDFIKNRKYKKAFILLQKVLNYYKEQEITQGLETNLGIALGEEKPNDSDTNDGENDRIETETVSLDATLDTTITKENL